MTALEAPRVSVVLPVRNGEPFLRYQLEALARQHCTFAWEVIVVDNGSTDTSAATAAAFAERLPGLRVLHEDLPGKSHALNRGIAAARGEHLLFVDADDEAGEGYVQKMSEGLETYDLVGGWLDTSRLNVLMAQSPMIDNETIPTYLGFRPGLPGGILGIRSQVRKRVGDYDPTFTYAEDVDFTWRAQALGASFGRQPDAIMHVRRPPTPWAAFVKSRNYARARVWLYEKYRSQGMHRQSWRAAAGPLCRAVRGARRREPRWQWQLAWTLGTLVGSAAESVRRRTLYL